ncbi:MAG: hypothetical protein A2X56_10605 [Nitrospirae bacterium GWC2_57_13]|jgi:two-component system, NtrC family, sensor kinase|nr:MAG: hypothetical protein A2X56_10605 [Nitrospirae bacterium GWC2_57_13]
MANYAPSIRKKITLGYFAIVLLIIGLSLFAYLELSYIEQKVIAGEAISEFFDTTLEIRRFEKNYVLYTQRPDYVENRSYVDKAQALLETNKAAFEAIAQPATLRILREQLSRYRDLMAHYALLSRSQSAAYIDEAQLEKMKLEGMIRMAGKTITTTAEEMSKTERQKIQRLLNTSQSVLLFSLVFLSIITIAVGHFLSRLVVRPLKMIERNMEVIAEGNFDSIKIDSKDREIASLTRAFNKMLRELELRQRHIVQSEKLASLGTLLSGVAHELNNPLSNISSSNQILLEEMQEARVSQSDTPQAAGGPFPDPAFALELLSQISDQAERARNIVRSLLEFSRDREFQKVVLPLKKLLEETIRFIKGQVPPNVTITLDIPDDLMIPADKQRIQRAFLNLIKNALEEMLLNGSITITAHKHTAHEKSGADESGIHNYLKYRGKCTLEEDTVDIQVVDTGPGIPADILPKIFDPFFTTKDVGKGSGLGLFIVHEIIEEHGGCIAVDSEPGRGTTFLIQLPLKERT